MPSGGSRPGAGRPKKVDIQNCYSSFTNDQLQELLGSPFIAFVSRTTVSYTKAFKEIFWKRYCEGVEAFDIFADAGLNPSVIGKTRIHHFIKTLRTTKAKGLPFTEGNEPQLAEPVPEKAFVLPPVPRKTQSNEREYSASEISKLVHQVRYLTQELEFIKKIILAEMEAK